MKLVLLFPWVDFSTEANITTLPLKDAVKLNTGCLTCHGECAKLRFVCL